MNIPRYPWLLCLISLVAIAPVFGGGEIYGRVVDENNNGFPGIGVYTVDEQGQSASTFTDALGNFSFSQLNSGIYAVRIQEHPGLIITSPGCGSFTANIRNGETRQLLFRVNAPGVSVDFGRPAGGGNIRPSLLPDDELDPNQIEYFSFAMRIHNMYMVEPGPQKFVLIGYFNITSPDVNIIIENVTLADSNLSGNAEIDFTHGQGPLLQVEFETHEWPYLSQDGDVLIFSGMVISQKGTWLSNLRDILCFCVQNLTFYYNNEPSDNVELRKFSQSWASCFPVKRN